MPDTQISEEMVDAFIAAFNRGVFDRPAFNLPVDERCRCGQCLQEEADARSMVRAALEAALSGHVVGWQTMDGAPKDGTEIMVAGGKFYSTADDWKTEYEHTDWNLASWRDGGWQGERDEQYDTYYYYKPTHWMPKVPLPAPPVQMEG